MLTERDVEKMDYYELLGLGHVAMRCSADLIKKACTYVPSVGRDFGGKLICGGICRALVLSKTEKVEGGEGVHT